MITISTLPQIVQVKRGFARNFLIPQGKAVYGTTWENIDRYATNKAEVIRKRAEEQARDLSLGELSQNRNRAFRMMCAKAGVDLTPRSFNNGNSTGGGEGGEVGGGGEDGSASGLGAAAAAKGSAANTASAKTGGSKAVNSEFDLSQNKMLNWVGE
jgi:hypothetical protein